MKSPATTRAELLAWLRGERECVVSSYREVDGVVRDPRALNDLRMIDALRKLVPPARKGAKATRRSK
jgi:hypothetical protein